MATRAVLRHSTRSLVIGAGLAVLGACRVSHEPSHLTPLDTVLTYQSAFAHDDGEAEYRCLSRRLKRAGGLEGYSLMRERFFEPLGAVGRCVLRRNSLEDNLSGLAIGPSGSVLAFGIAWHDFVVSLTREEVLRVIFDDGHEATGVPRIQTRGGLWFVHTDLPAAAIGRLEQQATSCLILEAPWRIDDLRQGIPGELDFSDPEQAADAPAQKVPLAELRWEAGAADLGSVEVRFVLPAPAEAGRRPVVWSLPER